MVSTVDICLEYPIDPIKADLKLLELTVLSGSDEHSIEWRRPEVIASYQILQLPHVRRRQALCPPLKTTVVDGFGSEYLRVAFTPLKSQRLATITDEDRSRDK